jgi:hypothetical protein
MKNKFFGKEMALCVQHQFKNYTLKQICQAYLIGIDEFEKEELKEREQSK